MARKEKPTHVCCWLGHDRLRRVVRTDGGEPVSVFELEPLELVAIGPSEVAALGKQVAGGKLKLLPLADAETRRPAHRPYADPPPPPRIPNAGGIFGGLGEPKRVEGVTYTEPLGTK